MYLFLCDRYWCTILWEGRCDHEQMVDFLMFAENTALMADSEVGLR